MSEPASGGQAPATLRLRRTSPKRAFGGQVRNAPSADKSEIRLRQPPARAGNTLAAIMRARSFHA